MIEKKSNRFKIEIMIKCMEILSKIKKKNAVKNV